MAVASIARQLGDWLQQSAPEELPILVETAQLELAPTPLHAQIGDFADRCQNSGIDRIVIMPLFLIPGVHVMEDIPAEVAIADRQIGDRLKLVVTSFLGNNPDFTNLFAQNRSTLPSQSIILAHGSRRAGGNEIVERLAHDLDLQAAYWSVPPSLAERVADAISAGATEIGILPYFLFAGGITDAIAESIAQLRQQYPQVKLILGEPILQGRGSANGNSPELVKTIGKIFKKGIGNRE
jgi:sirohydrochlorin ferrochelatase